MGEIPVPFDPLSGAAGDVQPLADATAITITPQQNVPLIRLDQFRADPRFAGINGQGQTVVVLDTGINLDHPFFGPDADQNGIADRIVFAWDFAEGITSNDGNGHGSNVASIIGSQDATYGGMAPGCNIIALKVLNNNGQGSFAGIEAALQWVVANRAAFNVVAVNMSLGDGSNSNSPHSDVLSDEIAALKTGGVAVVCASGNAYTPDPSKGYQTQGVSYPSSDPNAWSVGAVWDRNIGAGLGVSWSTGAIDFSTGADRIMSFSQRSTTMSTIFAPGSFIGGAGWDGLAPGTVALYSGTSQATPHISGLVADMQQLALRTSGHLMSVDDLRSTMRLSAAPIFDGDNEFDNVSNTFASYGRVDALAWGSAVLSWLFAGTAAHDTLNGTPVDDNIRGQGGDDTLVGNAGSDILDGGAGADTTIGGTGNDSYLVDNAGDAVIENPGEGSDTVFATTHFRLSANVENLSLQGSADLQAYGNGLGNALYGNVGSNLLDGGVGADTMSGGPGNDVYFVDNSGDVVIEVAGAGSDVAFSTVDFTLPADVEALVLQGNADLQGFGNGGTNTLYGNAGNNLLDGAGGADLMVGGAGNDTYFVDNAGDAALESPGEGDDSAFASAHYGLAADVETLVLQGGADLQGYGNSQGNTLFGNTGNNLLNGAGGADTMIGGAGNDTYFVDNGFDQVVENAGEGTDAVFSTVHFILPANVETLVLQGGANANGTGNALANSIFGDASNNMLDGQGNADTLTGNAGNDTFVLIIGQGNGDAVVDFGGNGGGVGDSLRFVGYGSGATFTQNDATHWQVNYAGGASHEVITFMNGAPIDASDVMFV